MTSWPVSWPPAHEGPAALLMPSEEQKGAQRGNRGAQREGEWLPWIHALRERGDDGYETRRDSPAPGTLGCCWFVPGVAEFSFYI